MTSRGLLGTAICGIALATGCGGGDSDTLTRAETGAKMSKICGQVEAKGRGLNGDPANDVPILKEFVPAFDRAVDEIRDLDVPDELSDTRDRFVELSDKQVALAKEAQRLAESGDRKAYVAKVEEMHPVENKLAPVAGKLGAFSCSR